MGGHTLVNYTTTLAVLDSLTSLDVLRIVKCKRDRFGFGLFYALMCHAHFLMLNSQSRCVNSRTRVSIAGVGHSADHSLSMFVLVSQAVCTPVERAGERRGGHKKVWLYLCVRERKDTSWCSQVVSLCNGPNVIIVLLALGPGRKSIGRLVGCNTASILQLPLSVFTVY